MSKTLLDTLPCLIVGGKLDFFGVKLGLLSLNKSKNKSLEQILQVVSFTTDHGKQFYSHFHFTYPPCLVSKISKNFSLFLPTPLLGMLPIFLFLFLSLVCFLFFLVFFSFVSVSVLYLVSVCH